MLQPGGEPDLALEALGPERGGQLGVEHLEGDRAVVLDVVREEDRGHAAAAELALERVAVAQAFLELRAQVGHARPVGSWRWQAFIVGPRRSPARLGRHGELAAVAGL